MPDHSWIAGDAVIPNIDEPELVGMMKRFTPLIRREGEFFLFDVPYLRRTAYTWEPKNLMKISGFRQIVQIETIHSCGYYGFFKPSIAEVMACAIDYPDIMLDFNIDSFAMRMDHIDIFESGSAQRAIVDFGTMIP